MKIIIVDGKESDRNAIQDILGSITAHEKPVCESIKTADNGKAGYDQIRTEKPDLVIMDIGLPGMSGLSMLKKLRAEDIGCHVLVLTADMDFKTAQQAISLGVDDYLLKPVKKARLSKAVLNIEEKIAKERASEKALSRESIFMGCLNGQIHPDQEFDLMTEERCGFALHDPGALFLVWLGSRYMEQREKVKSFLENVEWADRSPGVSVCVIPVDTWHVLTTVVYCDKKRYSDSVSRERIHEKIRQVLDETFYKFRDQVAPMLSSSVQGELACIWGTAEYMTEFPELLRRLQRLREWNLIFDRGELFREEDIKCLDFIPLKYPADLESQARQAVLSGNREEIRKCYYRLYAVFREKPHTPGEIKEALIRFSMSLIGAYKAQNEVKSELQVQDSMYGIRAAMSWGEIRKAMDQFFRIMEQDDGDDQENSGWSPLIRRAMQIVYKYYDQGITLEEIAGQLFVSEEYLSSQFKKETGAGFKDTVRRLRIERIKGLLVNTGLKLNQIAELAGYTDPKYMSRVFKEETGVLPNEFRKAAR